MASSDNNGATYSKTIHIGDYIKDLMVARNMQVKDLARLANLPISSMSNIINGYRLLKAADSTLIGKALGVSDDTFFNLQNQLALDNARNSKDIAQQADAIAIWIRLRKYISEKFFKKVGAMTLDVQRDSKLILEIFGVKDIEEFMALHDQEPRTVYYRKSKRLTSDEADLFSWKYYCIYESNKKRLWKPFNKKNITPLCKKLKTIFAKNTDVVNRTEEACEKAGIKFLTIEKEGIVPVEGMSFWRGDNPTIVMNMQREMTDNFAYAIMHELGHIALHMERDGRVFMNIPDETAEDSMRSDADLFAKIKMNENIM